MTILWSALGVVLLLTTMPTVIGFTLDDDYRSSLAIVIERSPEEIWEVVADTRGHPVGGSAVQSVTEIESRNGLPAWREDFASSASWITTIEEDAPRRTVRRSENAEDSLEATWTLEITPTEGGQEVRIAHDVTVIGDGWFSANLRFVMRFLGGAELAPRRYLESLSAELGGGAVF